jgi:hypothetical protein
MTSMFRTSILALFLLACATPQATTAQVAGPSAGGSFQFTSADGLVKYLEFDARADERGTTTGRVSLSGQTWSSDPSLDGDGAPRLGDTPSDFYLKAEFDCLAVSGNRAVMGGVVREASTKGYTGQRLLLVVEDNEADPKTHDRVTWILYDAAAGGWVPKDAERPDDNGATLKWVARDAERPDDVGVPYPKESKVIGCQGYPLSSHTFVYTRYADGDIRVRL